jgi:hypothetical protein
MNVKEAIQAISEKDRNALLEFLMNSLNHSTFYGAMGQRGIEGKLTKAELEEFRICAEKCYNAYAGSIRHQYCAWVEMIDGQSYFCEHFLAGDAEVKKEDFELLLHEIIFPV